VRDAELYIGIREPSELMISSRTMMPTRIKKKAGESGNRSIGRIASLAPPVIWPRMRVRHLSSGVVFLRAQTPQDREDGRNEQLLGR
jgi:hypothetical protein